MNVKLRNAWFKFNEHFGTSIIHPQFIKKSFERKAVQLAKKYGKGKKMVDIGCGRMPYKEELELSGVKYIGVDHPNVSKLFKSARKPDVFADVKKLPFSSGTFDIVLLLQVLEYVDSPQEAFNEIARVLKPNGILISSSPFLYPIHDIPFDKARYTDYSLVDFANKSSLTIISLEKQGGFLDFWIQSLNVFIFKRIENIISSKRTLLSIINLAMYVIFAPFIIVTGNIFSLVASRLYPTHQKYENYFPSDFLLVAKKNKRK
jgi:ubiquinone/menaquinone biosynthesis C-methylase UbiE